MVIQLFQHYSIVFDTWPKLSCLLICGFISAISILYHWSIRLSSCQRHAVMLSLFCFVALCFLNWSIIVLQCCVSFCCSTKSISCMYTDIPSLMDHPTHLGHHRAPSWAPCAIQQVPLATYFTHGSVYMSIPISHFIHVPLTPVSTRLFSVSASLFLP